MQRKKRFLLLGKSGECSFELVCKFKARASRRWAAEDAKVESRPLSEHKTALSFQNRNLCKEGFTFPNPTIKEKDVRSNLFNFL